MECSQDNEKQLVKIILTVSSVALDRPNSSLGHD